MNITTNIIMAFFVMVLILQIAFINSFKKKIDSLASQGDIDRVLEKLRLLDDSKTAISLADRINKSKTYVELAKNQLERFNKSRDIEWQGNFGVWALIVLSGQFLVGKYHLSWWWAPSTILFLIFLAHLVWLLKVQDSEDTDHELFIQCRSRAISLLGDEPLNTNIDTVFPRGMSRLARTWWWVVLEAMVTAVLGIIIIYMLNSFPVDRTPSDGELLKVAQQR